jgi:AraC-like DNA-binding protein
MQMLLRHKLLIAVAAVVAAASAGGAYAATQSTTNPRQAFVNDMAKRLHVSPAQLTSAFKAALIDRLNTMVEAGQLTPAQAKRIEQRIASGHLPLFFDRPWQMGFHARGLVERGALHVAGSYLGLTDRQLLADLASGKSLAQIAQARGKSVSGLEQALTNAAKARLDRLVSAGVITNAREQRLLTRLSAKISRLVNRSLPVPPKGAIPWAVPPGGAIPHGVNGPIPPPDGFGPPASE